MRKNSDSISKMKDGKAMIKESLSLKSVAVEAGSKKTIGEQVPC